MAYCPAEYLVHIESLYAEVFYKSSEVCGPCDLEPCQNEGVCSSTEDATGYVCTCAAGYSGPNCEVG